jgi:hypothetical protein
VTREGERAKLAAESAYNASQMREKGLEIMSAESEAKKKKIKGEQKLKKQKSKAKEEQDDGDAESVNDIELETSEEHMSEEERVLGFDWDGKGKFMDATKLTATYRELEYVENQATLMKERLADEIVAMQEISLSILKTRVVGALFFYLI